MTIGRPVYFRCNVPRRGASAPVSDANVSNEVSFIYGCCEVLNLKLVERLAVLYLRECPTVGVRV